MNRIVGRVLAGKPCRTCATTGEVHIHGKDAGEFSIVQGKHTAEEDLQISLISGSLKRLVGEQGEFFPRHPLRRDWHQMNIRTVAMAEFTESKTLALW